MMGRSVLVVGLSPLLREAFASHARRGGLHLLECPKEVPPLQNPDQVALCVVEAQGDDESVYQQVRALTKTLESTPLVVLVGRLRASTFARLNNLGVASMIDLPAQAEDVVAQSLQHLADPDPVASEDRITGESDAMRGVRRQIGLVARTRSTVLLVGETGTGKGMVARAIHDQSPWSRGPFIHVDCAALSPTLIESELFGHERGAFTGAAELRRGRFEMAERGSVFLDEIGDLDTALQAKLLRVLQDRTYERVGGARTLQMNARVIAATNQNLSRTVRDGRFRPDLYYRLNVFEIRLPPLRDRLSDLPLLVRAGLDRLAERLGVAAPGVSDAFYTRLGRQSWPGNVRELMNILERCLVQRRVETLEPEDLDGILDERAEGDLPPEPEADAVGPGPEPLQDERQVLTRALREAGWNVSRAARRLGIPRGTLRYRIRQHGLDHLIPRD